MFDFLVRNGTMNSHRSSSKFIRKVPAELFFKEFENDVLISRVKIRRLDMVRNNRLSDRSYDNMIKFSHKTSSQENSFW